jgi:hypothetical protein
MEKNVDILLNDLREKIISSGILTITTNTECYKWDIIKNKKGDGIYLGNSKYNKVLISKIHDLISEHSLVSFIFRNFTDQNHPRTKEPIKEIWGYILYWNKYDELTLHKSNSRELFDSLTTNHKTGEYITPELEVVYCGGDKIFGWDYN